MEEDALIKIVRVALLGGLADTLIGTLTVAEMLLYTAELKRPMTEQITKKKEAVDALLEDLGLTPCKDTLIGDAMHRGISGGQARVLAMLRSYGL